LDHSFAAGSVQIWQNFEVSMTSAAPRHAMPCKWHAPWEVGTPVHFGNVFGPLHFLESPGDHVGHQSLPCSSLNGKSEFVITRVLFFIGFFSTLDTNPIMHWSKTAIKTPG
jgi:hypothetical protein